MTFKTVSTLFGLLLVCFAVSAAAQQSIPMSRIVQGLDGNDLAAKEAVVGSLLKQAGTAREAAVDSVIARELERLNANRRLDRQARAAAYGVEASDEFSERFGDYYGNVIKLAGQSDRPVMIGPLAGALATGGLALDGLVKFGEQIVPVVAKIARDRNETNVHLVAGAMRALEKIKLAQGTVSSSTHAEMVGIANSRLSGKQEPVILVVACRLAAATGDPGLRARVQQLATSRSELTKMSVTDDASVKYVQDAARKVLGIK